MLSNLFRSRSEKLESNPRVSTCEPSAATTTATSVAFTSLSFPSWFAAIFTSGMKKKSSGVVRERKPSWFKFISTYFPSWFVVILLFGYEKSIVERKRRPRADQGMSLGRTGDSDEDCERSPLVWFSRNFFQRLFSREKKR